MANPLNYRRPEPAAPIDSPPGRSRWRWQSRGALLLVMIVVTLSGVALYAGSARMVVCYRLLTDGGMLALWIVAAIGLGHIVLRLARIWERDSVAALRWTTAAALGLGIMSLSILAVGLAGILNAVSAWAILAAGWACGIFTFLVAGRSAKTAQARIAPMDEIANWLKESIGWGWLALLATPFLAQAIIAAMVPPGMLWNPQEPHGYDVVEYHLQVPREWYEAHRIVPLHHNAFSYFPFNVEMHYLLAMQLRGGPWAGMYLAQLMHVAFMALSVLAVYGIARAMAPPAIASISSVSLLTVPWLTQLAGIAYDEGGFLLFGILAIGLSVIATFDDSHRARRFALAGVMAGFAAGSKLTGVPEVLVAVPVVTLLAVSCRMIRGRSVPSSLYPGERVRVRGESREQLQPGPLPQCGSRKEESRSTHQFPIFNFQFSIFNRLDRERRQELKIEKLKLKIENCPVGPHCPSPQPSLPSTGEREPDGIRPKTSGSLWLGIIVFSLFGLASFSPWLLRNMAWAKNPVFPELMPLLGKNDFNSRQMERWELAHKASAAEQTLPARLEKFRHEILLGWQFGYLLVPLALVAFAISARRPQTWCLLAYLVILDGFWLFFTHLQGRFFLLAAPVAALMVAQCNWRRATPAIAIVVVVFATIAWWNIHRLLIVRLNGVNNDTVHALGAEDLSDLLLAEIAPDGFPAGVKLVLIGDARAFWYPVPMSRLRYRCVFDVKGDGPDFLTAWGGSEVNEPGAWVAIEPSEIRRFLRTYKNLPPVPDDVLRRDWVYVIKR